MKTAKYWIEKLNLQKHPEGGWFKEVYRADEIIPQNILPQNFSGDRNVSTAIYYLLEGNDFSAFHRIKSDELWHFYTGTSGIELLWIEDGKLRISKLGPDFENDQHFQLVIKKKLWFAARLIDKNGFALVGCTVSPGFHFTDFEMANKDLLKQFPRITNEIVDLVKG